MRLKPVLGPFELVFYSVGVIIGAGVYSVLGAAAALRSTILDQLSRKRSRCVAHRPILCRDGDLVSRSRRGIRLCPSRLAASGLAGVRHRCAHSHRRVGDSRHRSDRVRRLSARLRRLARAFIRGFASAGCTAFNIWGMRESSWMNVLFTSVEVIGLLLVVAAAWMYDGPPANRSGHGNVRDGGGGASLLRLSRFRGGRQSCRRSAQPGPGSAVCPVREPCRDDCFIYRGILRGSFARKPL